VTGAKTASAAKRFGKEKKESPQKPCDEAIKGKKKKSRKAGSGEKGKSIPTKREKKKRDDGRKSNEHVGNQREQGFCAGEKK